MNTKKAIYALGAGLISAYFINKFNPATKTADYEQENAVLTATYKTSAINYAVPVLCAIIAYKIS